MKVFKKHPWLTSAAKRSAAPESPLPFLPHQDEVFHAEAANIVYVKGRRAGGTTGAILRLIELVRTHKQSRHLWIDTVQRNIGRYVRRMILPHTRPGEVTWHAAQHSLTFHSTGARVDFGSTQLPQNLEGFGYDYLWINEAGHVLRDESLYHNTLQPMLLDASSAQSFFVGTPKGRGLFQRMYNWGQGAESGTDKPGWKSFRHPSTVNPLVNATLLDEFRAEMPESVYRQEVLAEFIDDATQVFRNLEHAAVAKPEPTPTPGCKYVMGLDLARHRDATALWVGRVDTRAAVFCDRFQGIPWAQQVARVAAIARRYGNATAHVDATGVGDAVCEQLRTAGVTVRPHVFTAERKRSLIEHLAAALEGGTFTFAPHEQTQRELEVFEYQPQPVGNPRLSAPSGQYDDCVIALALCHHALIQPRGQVLLGPQWGERGEPE